MTLSTTPPRGTQDWFPEEMKIRQYIFDTRHTICEQFSYEQYLWPIVEDTAIRKAKSGEDVWWSELTRLTDREWNVTELALRPEMTPTVTRMVVKQRNALNKPTRRYSVANFYRNERPQRGRNREFRQLNVDMFGEVTLMAEVEVLTMAIETMKAFGADETMFQIYINHRHLTDMFLGQYSDDTQEIVRLLDKWNKLSPEIMKESLWTLWINEQWVEEIFGFMNSKSVEEVAALFSTVMELDSFKDLQYILAMMKSLWYEKYLAFTPSLMRGFDYYDGMVFEVFDLHPDNNRAMFGGGRYNGLADIFGAKETIPAIGFAPWDETTRLFLDSRGLLPEIPMPTESCVVNYDDENPQAMLQAAAQLRSQWWVVEQLFTMKSENKLYKYAQKKGYGAMIVIDEKTGEVMMKWVWDQSPKDQSWGCCGGWCGCHG